MNHLELSYCFMQCIAILQPKVIGKGKGKTIEIDLDNCFNLAKFQFNEMTETNIQVTVMAKKSYWYHYEDGNYSKDYKVAIIKPVFSIIISGQNFCYSCSPDSILMVWDKLSKILDKSAPEIFIPEVIGEFTPELTLNKQDIQNFKTVSKFTACDEFRPVMNCVYLTSGEMAATDAHKLIKRSIDYTGSLLINKNGQKFINKAKNFVEISTNDKQIKLFNGIDTLVINKESGQYPNYKVLETTFKFQATIDRKKLIEAINKVSIYANQSSNLIKLSFTDKLSISAQDIDFAIDSYQYVNCESNFTGQIGYKSDFLIEVLKADKSDTVTFCLNDESKLTEFDGIVLMPMMLINALPIITKEISKAKYDKSAIMKHAWLILRSGSCDNWSTCLKMAWNYAKGIEYKQAA
jgi:hypothetical protein